MTILSTIFLCIYYNVILKDHTGPMDWWAIMILIIPIITLMITIIPLICIRKKHFKNQLEVSKKAT